MPVHLEKIAADVARPTKVNFDRLRDHANQLESTVLTLRQQLAAVPPPPTLDQIQKALSAGGSNPLNLTGLQGSSTATTAVAKAVAGIPAPPPTPQPPPHVPPGTDPPPVTGPPIGPAGGDAVPFASIVIVNSPNVSGWASTAVITQFGMGAAGFAPVFAPGQSGPAAPPAVEGPTTSWPDVTPPGWDGPIQFTLWTVLKIGGQWYASGVIQFWRGLVANGGPPDGMGTNWFYGSAWGPMSGYQPAVGESVGFFVTAGNERQGALNTIVMERSNIIVIPYPTNLGQVFTFS